jgi:hypothetical protein
MTCKSWVLGALMTAALTSSAMAQDASGDWYGILTPPGAGPQHLTIHIRKGPAGLEGSLDNQEAGHANVPLQHVTVSAGELTFDVPSADGHYQAQWVSDYHIWLGAMNGLSLVFSATKPAVRHAITLDAKVLETYVGRYELSPQQDLTITRQGDHLWAQLTGQDAIEIFPETQKDFFWQVVDAQLTFQPGPDGKAIGLILHQYGQNDPGKRID